jgi:hypothetical protein
MARVTAVLIAVMTMIVAPDLMACSASQVMDRSRPSVLDRQIDDAGWGSVRESVEAVVRKEFLSGDDPETWTNPDAFEAAVGTVLTEMAVTQSRFWKDTPEILGRPRSWIIPSDLQALESVIADFLNDPMSWAMLDSKGHREYLGDNATVRDHALMHAYDWEFGYDISFDEPLRPDWNDPRRSNPGWREAYRDAVNGDTESHVEIWSDHAG